MPKDLRVFLNLLKRQHPGEIACVSEPVNPAEFEVLAVVNHLAQQNANPVLVFKRVNTLKGDPWPGQFVVNVDPGTFRRAAITMGLDPDATTSQEVVNTISRGISSPIEPVVISRDEAPVKQVVRTGEAVDLSDIPLLMHYEKDTRPGWCTPIIAAADLTSGVYNLSYHRTLFKGPRRVTASITARDLGRIVQEATARNEPLPVALIIGHHPGFYVSSAMRPPPTANEYAVAGGVLDEPLRLVASETWGEQLLIPADAEIVVEGFVSPGEKDLEAPFGEWSRYYGPQTRKQVIELTALNMRRDAIFQAVRTSYHIIEDIAHSAGLYAHLRARFPNVVAASSFSHTWAIISIKKRRDGEPQRIGGMALGYGNHVKNVVIVDDDVDPFNLRQVIWAIGVRSQPDQAIQVLRNVEANNLDPSTTLPALGSIMILDATVPLSRPFQTMVKVPAAVQKRISADFDRYLSPEKVRGLQRGDPWQV